MSYGSVTLWGANVPAVRRKGRPVDGRTGESFVEEVATEANIEQVPGCGHERGEGHSRGKQNGQQSELGEVRTDSGGKGVER